MLQKIYFLIVLTLVCGSDLFAQYNKQKTYLDALELANIMNSIPRSTKDTTFTINSFVEAFGKTIHKYGNDQQLLANPFLKDHLLGIYPPDTLPKKNYYMIWDSVMGRGKTGKAVDKAISYSSAGLVAGALGSASWQASAINGIANFMAGRFKQEALHVVIDQMLKQINTEKDAQLIKSVFPQTFTYIERLYGSGSSSYYTADLLQLRHTAQFDIEQLPKNIIRNPEGIFPLLQNNPKMKDMLSLGSYIVEYSQQGQSLDRLVSSLANERYSSDSSVYKILNVADLISQALLDTAGSKDKWVNPLNILSTTDMSLKKPEVRYFYGLLYQQMIQVPEFRNYLEVRNADDIIPLAIKMQDLIRFVNKLNNTYSYVKSRGFDLKTPEEIMVYVNNINLSMGQFVSTLKSISAINERYLINDTVVDASGKYIAIFEAILKKDYQQVIPRLTIEFGTYMSKEIKFSRTIAFVSQLATVENAADMERLLNAYALPIGSASIKRHSSFNISLNGYVGLAGGWETAYGSQKNQTKGNIGLSAPIGISVTVGKGFLTPFVSFLDLGSMVNQRLNNDTVSYSNLRLEHFFSPGIGLLVNCPKLPVSAGVHFSYIPNLRTIKYESGNATITELDRSVTRINFSLLVDIPFFTIYNRDKARRY